MFLIGQQLQKSSQKRCRFIVKFKDLRCSKIRSFQFLVANFDQLGNLRLVAVVLILLLTLGDWGILAVHPRFGQAGRFQRLGLALVADLPRDLLAVLGVRVDLGLLGLGLGHQLADLLPLEVAVLSLHGEGNILGELIAVALELGLANLDLNLYQKNQFPCVS